MFTSHLQDQWFDSCLFPLFMEFSCFPYASGGFKRYPVTSVYKDSHSWLFGISKLSVVGEWMCVCISVVGTLSRLSSSLCPDFKIFFIFERLQHYTALQKMDGCLNIYLMKRTNKEKINWKGHEKSIIERKKLNVKSIKEIKLRN